MSGNKSRHLARIADSRVKQGVLASEVRPTNDAPTPQRQPLPPLTFEDREREASYRKINAIRSRQVVRAALAIRCREHSAQTGQWCTHSEVVRGLCGPRVEAGRDAWLDPSTLQAGESHMKGGRL